MEAKIAMEGEDSQKVESAANERLMNYLHDAVKTTIKKYLSHFPFRVFKQNYPELVAHDRKDCKTVHLQLIDQLGKSITGELSKLFKDEKVFLSLKRLDEIISTQQNRTEGWRPTGNPDEDLRDHLYREKLKHKERLLKMFQDIESENQELLKELSERHDAIQDIRKEIKDMNSEMNACFKELTESCRNSMDSLYTP